MPVLNDIVHSLNESLVKTLFSQSKRFKGAKLFGISEQAIRTGDNKQEYPQIVDLSGDGKYTGIDDTFPLILYHKKQGVAVTIDTAPSYGDNQKGSINRYSLSMIVFFNRTKLKMESDEMALYLQQHFITQPKNDNFHYLSVTINSVILNSQQVFRTEYVNVNYFLKPEHALMAINYTLEGKPDLACFNRCPE